MRTLIHAALPRAAALIALGAAAAVGPPPTGDADADREGIYHPPQRPLDPRIDPEKVTEYDPPPLAQQVVLPVPPEFRIADGASQVPVSADHFARAHKAIDEGLVYLRSTQGTTGGWLTEVRIGPTDQPDQPSPIAVAVTALALKAMIQADSPIANGAVVEDVRFQLALRFVRSAQRDDGAYEGGALTNYVTSMVVMALATIDRHDFRDELKDATSWLQVNQWDQTEGLSPRQDWYGGAGYGNQGRPDLSNTQTMLDALYEAGMSPDEPAVQRALSFVSRAQNLQATNKAAWSGNDGGFVYTPANGGESMASEVAGEGRTGRAVAAGQPRSLRSYGSMTYAGFKSMFHAGLSPDDLRVRAAFDWIRHHWTFDENPGLGQQGLYYYYHTMARALRAAQQDVITDIDGTAHNWREELIDALVARKRDDGSWLNGADRWLEGQPVMATIFAVLALEEALKPVVPKPVSTTARPVAALRFVVTYDGSITESYTGRIYVMLSTTASPEPRHGPAWRNTAPFFALDVEDWKPDTPLIFDEGALGFPGPPGTIEQQDYWIQAVMRRNLDSPSIGDGQGTAVSAVVTRELEGPTGGEVVLRIDRLVGGQPFAAADDIRLIETRSDLLSDFYGRDVMLRAAVILPPGYDDTDRRYPALYFIGGFGTDHRLAPSVKRRFSALAGAERVCFVVPDPLCRTGHHAFADSDNNGPRGRALVEELIPALERELRLVAAPTARFLTGVSSGGWSSLWLQVAHPDFFGGVWSVAPDPVDFRAFQRIDVYAPGANVYLDEHGKPRPIMRMRDRVMMWYEPFAKMEWVQGEGGQVGSFEAVFSPRGPDGRPALLFDRETGDVDPAVAETWKRYDIRLILQENWELLAPKLAGKVNVFVGDSDNFYLEGAVELLKAWQESSGAEVVVEIVPGRNHMNVLGPVLQQRIVRELLDTFDRHPGNER